MEDWKEEDLEEEGVTKEAEPLVEDWENEEVVDTEEEPLAEEPLETIIEETPVVSYPKATNRWPSSGPSITPQFSQSQEPLETGLQGIQAQTPAQEPQMAENAPEYSSITYQEIKGQEASVPEPIHTGSQSFSPSLPQHLLQSQFDTIPKMIQQGNMPDDLEKLRPQEKKYQADFEQNKKDRRRF